MVPSEVAGTHEASRDQLESVVVNCRVSPLVVQQGLAVAPGIKLSVLQEIPSCTGYNRY